MPSGRSPPSNGLCISASQPVVLLSGAKPKLGHCFAAIISRESDVDCGGGLSENIDNSCLTVFRPRFTLRSSYVPMLSDRAQHNGASKSRCLHYLDLGTTVLKLRVACKARIVAEGYDSSPRSRTRGIPVLRLLKTFAVTPKQGLQGSAYASLPAAQLRTYTLTYLTNTSFFLAAVARPHCSTQN